MKVLLVGIDNSGYDISNHTVNPIILGSSMVERMTVNHVVAGSSPARGAMASNGSHP